MGKTHNDEEYEKGVREGKAGDFIEDFLHTIIPDDSIREKGYQFGRKHRYEGSGEDEKESVCDDCAEDDDDDEEEEERRRKQLAKQRQRIVYEEEQPRKTYRDEIKEYVESLKGSRGILYVGKQQNRNLYKQIVAKNEFWLYTHIIFLPDKFEVTYKCDRCGHKWYDIVSEPIPKEADCRMGCTLPEANGKVYFVYRVLKNIFTKDPLYGFGRLIEKREI